MADLIERDALLKDMGLTDAVKYGNKDSEQQTRSYSTWMSYEIADAILDAPAVNRWIPCSERLPEKKGRYLCSMYYAIPPYHLLHPENDTYIRDVSIQEFDGKSFIASVVAWMPMPDAYEPHEEAQE